MSSMPLFRKPEPPRVGAGIMDAAANAAIVVGAKDRSDPLARSIADTLEDFGRLTTDEAKAGFANQWVGGMHQYLSHTWRAVYELGRIVKERELYKHARFMGGVTFPTFEAWWEQRTGKAMREFAELEKTHRFAESAGLLRLSYEDATAARQAVVDSTPVVAEHGGAREGAGRPGHEAEPKIPRGNQGDNVTLISSESPRGNKVPYLLGRIKREAQAGSQVAVTALKRYVDGEWTANRAAIEAGVKRPTLPIDTVLRLLPKLSAEERARVMARLNQVHGGTQ